MKLKDKQLKVLARVFRFFEGGRDRTTSELDKIACNKELPVKLRKIFSAIADAHADICDEEEQEMKAVPQICQDDLKKILIQSLPSKVSAVRYMKSAKPSWSLYLCKVYVDEFVHYDTELWKMYQQRKQKDDTLIMIV